MSDDITRISLGTASDADRTDWARVRALNEADIALAIAGDVDTFGVDQPSPTRVGLRYVLYRAAGGGWRWVLLDADGGHLAVSARSFASQEAVADAIDMMRSKLLAGDVKAA